VPIGLSWRTGTLSFEDAAAFAVSGAIYDTVWDSLSGNTGRIGDDLFANLLLVLLRRMEFFVGLTPGFYLGAPSNDPAVTTSGLVLRVEGFQR